jgi:hypothetical protein
MMRSIFFTILSLIIFQSVSTRVVFGDTYGSGNYGSAKYNQGSSTTSGSNNSVSGGGNSGKSSEGPCTNVTPSAPNFYQLDRQQNTATLYFTPANYADHYVISFGHKEGEEQYNARIDVSNSRGAIRYTVNELNPRSLYYFKVRSGNGCASGNWSGNILGRAVPVRSKKKISFYPSKSNFVTSVYRFGKNVKDQYLPKNSNKKSTTVKSNTATTPPQQIHIPNQPISVGQVKVQQPVKKKSNWFFSLFGW